GTNTTTINHPTVATMPNGAIVEHSAPSVKIGQEIHLQLQRADFTTAARVTEVLNQRFGPIAQAENAARITVRVPRECTGRPTEFVADLETLTVEPDRQAAVVVNERTGTITMGKDVHIAPVAIMHGNLTVEVQTSTTISQPTPMSSGST